MNEVFESWKQENKEFCSLSSKSAQLILFTIDETILDLKYIKSLQMDFGEGFKIEDINRVKIKLKALELHLKAVSRDSGVKSDTGISLIGKNPSTPSSTFY